MDSDTLSCPDDNNSTDCLLRAILQILESQDYNNDFDWEPVTFALALILDIAASVFAVYTVTQVVIAARKGYRKAGFQAIGEWSKATKGTWSWADINYEYTTSTPIIWIDSVLDLNEDSEAGISPQVKPSSPLFESASVTAATWPTFLRETGLASLVLPNNLRLIAVENLPDDIIAAPAYVQGGVIFAAAAAAGLRSTGFGKDPDRPVIVGRTFWFDFREHPIMGVFGSCSHYDPTVSAAGSFFSKSVTTNFCPIKLKTAMQHAIGTIQIHRGLSDDHTMNLFGNSDQSVDRIIYGKLRHLPDTKFDSYSIYFESLQQYIKPFHSFFYAITPRHLPALFPQELIKGTGEGALTTLALIGKYWSGANFDAFSKAGFNERLKLNRPEDTLSTLDYELPTWKGFQWVNGLRIRQSSENDGPYGYRVVLHMCMKQVYHPSDSTKWFIDASPESKNELRTLVLEQLKQVDKWIGERPVDLRVLQIIEAWLLLSRAEEVTKGAEFGEGDQNSSSQQRPNKITVCDQHSRMIIALRNLLETLDLDNNSLSTSDLIEPSGMGSEHRDTLESALKGQKTKLELLLGPISTITDYKLSAHQALDRLGVIVACLPESGTSEKIRKRYQHRMKSDEIRDLEDLIIYRFLLVMFLFRTAPDNSSVLNSTLWDRMIPII